MKRILNLLLSIIVSLALVFVGSKLIDMIPSNDAQSVDQMYLEAYPTATDIKEINLDNKPESINKVYEVMESDKLVGYIFDATSNKGYAGDINFLIGISSDGLIQGFNPIAHTETEGFGSKMGDSEFKDGLKGVDIKNGISAGEGDKENGEIVAITGATVSTDAIVSEIKTVVNSLATLSDEVNEIQDEIPYYANRYEELFEKEVDEYSFEEFEKDEFYNENVKRIIKVNKDGTLNSYILQLQSQGYGGTIDSLVRINDDYRVFNTVFANHNESPDYGGVIEKPEYINSLKGINLEKNFLTKAIKLKNNPVGEKDIPLIPGSIATSQAIQKALNAAIEKLVEFNKYKDDNSFYKELNYEEMLKENEVEIPEYDHASKFEGFESEELIEGQNNDYVVAVYDAVISGEEGYIFDVNSKGFAGLIEYGVFVNKDGQIKDFIIYKSNESDDYGAEIETSKYKEKILSQNLSALTEIKSGENIDSLSGATITTDAMKNSLNAVLELFHSIGQ